MVNVNRKIKLLSLLTVAGVIGISAMKFIPQASSNLPLAAAATYESDRSSTPRTAYSIHSQLYSINPSARINVRSGPGTSYSVKHYGFSGDKVTLLNDTGEGNGYKWYYLQFKQSGARGWVREDLVGDSSQPEQYVLLKGHTSKTRINVRSGPGTNYYVKHLGRSGDQVAVLDSTNGNQGYNWYQVKLIHSGAKGWVREDLLAFVAD